MKSESIIKGISIGISTAILWSIVLNSKVVGIGVGICLGICLGISLAISDSRTISIKCPAHAAKAIFSFAQALTPDTKLVDSVLILPEEYKQAVKTFIEVIL